MRVSKRWRPKIDDGPSSKSVGSDESLYVRPRGWVLTHAAASLQPREHRSGA